MRQPLRCLAVVTVAGIAAGGLAGCGLLQKETFKDASTLHGTITSVRLDNGSGGVTVNGTARGGAATVHREVQYRGSKPKGATHRIENGVLVLGGCGNECSVGYTVDVPAGTPITGKVSNGAVHLNRVGAVDIATSSGRIDLDGVDGAVAVRTSNGHISGKDIKGPRITARTSNGAIDLTPGTAMDITARTSNGKITLTVPDAGYRVTADTSNGDKNIGVRNDPSGRHRLGLTTSNGDITVRKA